MNENEVINKIIYYLISAAAGALDNIEGEIYDARTWKEYERACEKIAFVQSMDILLFDIGEILIDEGYEALGLFLKDTCADINDDKSCAALKLLEEERKANMDEIIKNIEG